MEAATTLDYKALYEELNPKYEAVLLELAQLKKMIFGSKHERFIPQSADSQLTLSLAVDAIANVTTETIEVTIRHSKIKPQQRIGKHVLAGSDTYLLLSLLFDEPIFLI